MKKLKFQLNRLKALGVFLLLANASFSQNFKEDFGSGVDTATIPNGSATTLTKYSGATNCPPPQVTDGTFVITANSGLPFEGSSCTFRKAGDLFFSGWHKTLKDNTGNTNGRFMLVNASSLTSEIYSRTVQLTTGNDYVFSSYVANILNPAMACTPENPVNLSFEVYNGTSLVISLSTGDIKSETTLENIWKKYELSFKAPSSTVRLVIKNTGKGGCGNDLAIDDISLITVSYSIPVVSIAAPTKITCNSPTVTLDGSASTSGANITYTWTATNGGAIVSGATTSKAVVSTPGSYTLTVTDIVTGYINTNSVIVDSDCTLGVADFDFANEFSVYPNPASTVLNIQAKKGGLISALEVYNLMGQMVMKVTDVNAVSKLDVSALSKGTYLLKANTNQGISTTKFVKE